MKKEQRQALELWAQLYARLDERLNRMPDDELQKLHNAALAASRTNCWCMAYKVAQILSREVGDILRRRAYSAEAKRIADEAAKPAQAPK